MSESEMTSELECPWCGEPIKHLTEVLVPQSRVATCPHCNERFRWETRVGFLAERLPESEHRLDTACAAATALLEGTSDMLCEAMAEFEPGEEPRWLRDAGRSVAKALRRLGER